MMPGEFDLIIRNGRCMTPSGLTEVDIAVSGNRIAQLGVPRSATSATTFDATGLVVLPGVIDSQVHFREPGLEHKEDLATGTRAAVAGGVTTIFEMPNTKPNTDTPERLQDKLTRAHGRAHANYAFFVGATAENADDLAQLERLPGCAGIKVFMGSSTGSLLVADQATLLRVLASGYRRVAIHAEDEPRLLERREFALSGSPVTHPHGHHRHNSTACGCSKDGARSPCLACHDCRRDGVAGGEQSSGQL
jgi:dihydroorotase